MSGISTHILDTTLGRPAAGVPVLLEQEIEGCWKALTFQNTDADGRVKQLLSPPMELIVGQYRISFETAKYFTAQNVDGLYPQVQITFLVRDSAAHYHIPLLLTANGYSTYRGS